MKKKEKTEKQDNTNLPQLPKNWKWVKLGDVASFEYGKALKKENRNDTGIFPVYGSNGIVGYHNESLIDEPAIIVGRKGAAGEVHLSTTSFWPIDTTYFIKKETIFELKYLYYLLKTLNLRGLDKSTAIPGLNRDDAYAKLIPLPPLSEQQRIITRIEEKFSEIDHGIEKLKLVRSQLKMYRQSVLKAAFEGKLGLGDKTTNLVQKVLEGSRVNATPSSKKSEETASSKKQIAPLTKAEIADLPQLPMDWKWVKINEVITFIGSGITPKGGQDVYQKSGIMFLRSQNVYPNKLKLDDVAFISEKINDKMKRSQVLPNDVLLNITGASIGRCTYVPEIFQRANVNQHVCILRLVHEKVKPVYLSSYLNSPESQRIITETFTGVTRQGLNYEQIRNLPIPLPPSLEIQNAIVSAIEARLSRTDRLEKVVEDNLYKAEKLKQSILKKAFQGGLSERLETDENIEEMLAQFSLEKDNPMKKVRIISEKVKKEEMTLEELLKEKFNDKAFSFEDIQKLNFDMDYDELKEKLFEFLDSGNFIHSFFDEKTETIKFRLVK